MISADTRTEGAARKGSSPHVACCTATASSRTFRGWPGLPRLDCLTTEPSSLGTPPKLCVAVCIMHRESTYYVEENM